MTYERIKFTVTRIVSDNASNFTSEEFAIFMRKNGIHHMKSSYHTASNNLAEQAYRITHHSSTGVSPAKVMFGRPLRSPMDAIRLDIGATSQQKQKNLHCGQVKLRDFYVEDLMYVNNYASGPTWLPGRIKEKSLETTSNTQETIEDAASPVLPLPIEQDTSNYTEDSTDSTTSNATADDTAGVPKAPGTTSITATNRISNRTSDTQTTVRQSQRSHRPPLSY
ncbi:PREDICTED: uncharacterized protein LOC109593833 [Amphimedon queenslandica]|uniref:Integrase catalytic domain-containing protein n=1 Tax=Amphimedon queenslandica TaxID=400682 RepID=A0AAN0K5E4_AMPQE|nr:PREDICTED: uncharacterized protein LOC109593833 [Amphimedon queenslandica]|eukprot:XP_019864504.1 PREDICTED: uncharacterized protein LOC109593833 [Amphimedon queenslandica]